TYRRWRSCPNLLQCLTQAWSHDDPLRRDDRDRMRERGAAQVGVEQSDDDPEPGETEPDRKIFRAVQHQEADDIASAQSLCKRPVPVALCVLRELAIAQC